MNKSVRNIIIVALFAMGGGWLGIWLNDLTRNIQPPMQSLGALVWLTTPALVGILLRLLGGDGWKDSGLKLHLGSSWSWYLLALILYPLASLLVFGLALPIHAISADGFVYQGLGAYGSVVGFMFVASLMKNLFEEFAWRGYLTPRLDAAKVPPLLNHFIVGVLWWSWHLPYYFYFIDRVQLNNYLGTTSLTTFICIALLVTFPTAILFGELRLRSKSVWPVFLLHQTINAVSMPLILNNFIRPNGTLGLIFSPTNDGILLSVLLGVVGLGIYRSRMKSASRTVGS